jgi:uncharacterized protein
LISRYRLPTAAFAELAAGRGDASTLGLLRSAQLSKHLLLLSYLVNAHQNELAEAAAVLAEAQRRAPQLVADLLTSPFVGAWAARCARQTRQGHAFGTELNHLGAIAAAAALRAGLDAELTTTALRGKVGLPTFGCAIFGEPDQSPARVLVKGGSATVFAGARQVVVPTEPSADTDGWYGLRQLTADCDGLQLTVALDDVDPYRGCYHTEVAGRISETELVRWRELFGKAWQLLTRHDRMRAAELTHGLHSIVPVAQTQTGLALSATSRDAYGALALVLPEDPALLAVTLVHEDQHSKLSALLDLVRLYNTGAPERYFAPWRRDPRPIGGLLQGAYAFLGVCDVWRKLRECPVEREVAEREFAELREQVRVVIDTLATSGHLTAQGERFVDGMRSALDPLLAEPLPSAVVTAARAALERGRAAWHERNAQP